MKLNNCDDNDSLSSALIFDLLGGRNFCSLLFMINLLADFVVRQTKQEDAFFRCENTYYHQEKPNVFVCAVKNADSAVIFLRNGS